MLGPLVGGGKTRRSFIAVHDTGDRSAQAGRPQPAQECATPLGHGDEANPSAAGAVHQAAASERVGAQPPSAEATGAVAARGAGHHVDLPAAAPDQEPAPAAHAEAGGAAAALDRAVAAVEGPVAAPQAGGAD